MGHAPVRKLTLVGSEQKPPPRPNYLAPFWTSCPVCDAADQAEVDRRDLEIRGGCDAKTRIMNERLAAAGIPARFKEATVWNWQHAMDQQRRVWQWASDYANQFDIALAHGRCGLFIGAPGTGKTHLAIGILRHIVEKGGSGHYTTVMDLLGRIKATFGGSSGETEEQVIREVCSCDMLVIDEVGRSLDTTYEVVQFFRVLDRRYRDVKPTILVSNLAKPEFIKFLGSAVCDRMREAGGKLMVFDWASQRSSKEPRDDA